jgi:hypothetical protein
VHYCETGGRLIVTFLYLGSSLKTGWIGRGPQQGIIKRNSEESSILGYP